MADNNGDNTQWTGPMIAEVAKHLRVAVSPEDIGHFGKIIKHIGDAAKKPVPDDYLKKKLRGLDKQGISVARRVPRLAKLIREGK